MRDPVTDEPFKHQLGRILTLVGISLGLLTVFVFGFMFLPQLLDSKPVGASVPPVLPFQDSAVESISTDVATSHSAEGESASNAPLDESSLVATVNGSSIDGDALLLQSIMDAAMAELTGSSSPESVSEQLARLINTELVVQDASNLGDILTDEQAATQLDMLLDSYGLDQSALATTLIAHGLTRAEFDSYFLRLLTADQHAAAQAAGQDITLNEYLQTLRANAHISYGPLAGEAAAAELIAANVHVDVETAEDVADEPAADVQPQPVKSNEMRSTAVGRIAPNFELPLLASEGDTIAFDQLLGQPSVVSFWTTWCPHCRRQTPVLIEKHQQYADQGLQVIGINVKDRQDDVEEYASEQGIEFTIGLDLDGYTARAWTVGGYPTTYFLNADGRVAARHIGALTSELFDQYAAQLLAE